MKASFPFRADKVPFFYGWVILFGGSLGVIMSIPGQTIGVSAFTEDVRAAIHISLSQWSLAYMIGTLISGFLMTQAGRLYDKLGSRVIGILTSVFFGLFICYLSYISKITNYANSISGQSHKEVTTIVLITIGFFGIRFFGQGILTLASRNMVMKWFDQYRGRVSIILGLFTIMFFNSSPFYIKKIISNFGWENTWRILALVVGVGFSLFAFIFFRDNAEDSNCVADGPLGKNKKNVEEKPLAVKDYTLGEVKRSYAFWIFNLVFVLNALYLTGLTLQVEHIFETNGYSENIAYSIFIPSAFIAVGFSIVGGFISDKAKLKYLLIFYAFNLAVSVLGMLFLDVNINFKWLIIFGNGVTGAMYSILNGVVWPRFFGIKHLGAISGFALSCMVIGSAIGPFFLSKLFDITGNYKIGSAIILFVAVSLTILATKVRSENEKAFLNRHK